MILSYLYRRPNAKTMERQFSTSLHPLTRILKAVNLSLINSAVRLTISEPVSLTGKDRYGQSAQRICVCKVT